MKRSIRNTLVILASVFALGVVGQAQAKSSDFSSARHVGKAKHSGCKGKPFFSFSKGGSCWVCPPGFKKTLNPAQSSKACKRPTQKYKKYRPGKRVDKVKPYQRCGRGQFRDLKGNCYACPKGFKRSLSKASGRKACVMTVKKSKQFARARFVKNVQWVCPRGQYFSVKRKGSCWTCPPGMKRNRYAKIDGSHACKRPGAIVRDLIKPNR